MTCSITGSSQGNGDALYKTVEGIASCWGQEWIENKRNQSDNFLERCNWEILYIACEHLKELELPLYLNEAVCHLSPNDYPE